MSSYFDYISNKEKFMKIANKKIISGNIKWIFRLEIIIDSNSKDY